MLRHEASLRGLAATRGVNREVFRKRFHRGVAQLHAPDPLTFLPPEIPLIALIDGLWFRYGSGRVRYCCYTILLRPIASDTAIVARMCVRRGKETRGVWESLFRRLPAAVTKRIYALVSDGFNGARYLAADRGWRFQQCQVHCKRRMAELRGVRNLPGRLIRQRVTSAVHEFLDTPDAAVAARALAEIHRLFVHPECPRTIRTRLAALRRAPQLYRTCWTHHELRLPSSTNSAECVNGAVRRMLTRVRGFTTPQQLKYWVSIFHSTMLTVMCRGVLQTVRKKHRISVS